MSESAWELIFMMFVLKLPIVYLIGVVWWAVRAQPDPYALVAVAEAAGPDPDAHCPWHRTRHTRPHPPVHRRTRATARARR